MSYRSKFLVVAILILCGVILFFLGLERNVTISIFNISQTYTTRAITVRSVLEQAGFQPKNTDLIEPGLNHIVWWHTTINYLPAASFTITSEKNGLSKQIIIPERIPANLLNITGIKLFPTDRILWNGVVVPSTSKLPLAESYNLQFIPAVKVDLLVGETHKTIYSSAPTVIEALWENGIQLTSADRVSPPAVLVFSFQRLSVHLQAQT